MECLCASCIRYTYTAHPCGILTWNTCGVFLRTTCAQYVGGALALKYCMAWYTGTCIECLSVVLILRIYRGCLYGILRWCTSMEFAQQCWHVRVMRKSGIECSRGVLIWYTRRVYLFGWIIGNTHMVTYVTVYIGYEIGINWWNIHTEHTQGPRTRNNYMQYSRGVLACNI